MYRPLEYASEPNGTNRVDVIGIGDNKVEHRKKEKEENTDNDVPDQSILIPKHT
jgi:hypothetical protein